SLGLLEDVHDLAIGKAGGFHRISFKSNNLEILLLSQVKGWGDYPRTLDSSLNSLVIQSSIRILIFVFAITCSLKLINVLPTNQYVRLRNMCDLRDKTYIFQLLRNTK
ncbi:hypothetical protein, partial [Polynucleobacter sp. UK-Gri1-W3]|uniref:hypothetical protein n=1 Tax=Polynucleobacter sp. UK-Gri1-W3 TaxID=1819737 RepID=UPI001C0E389C